jgi:hypothetical protein
MLERIRDATGSVLHILDRFGRGLTSDSIGDAGTVVVVLLVFVGLIILAVCVVRLMFLHKYEELKSSARFCGKNARARDDSRANRALDAIIGVGIRYQRFRLGLFLIRLAFWIGALVCICLAVWVGSQMVP